MPNTLSQLLAAHEDAIAEAYNERIRASSPHYGQTSAAELDVNIRRSLKFIGILHYDPEYAEARDYVRSLCELRVPQGYRLEEVMQAIFLLTDVVQPVIRDHFAGDRPTAQKCSDQLRTGIHRLVLLWAAGYYELQTEILDRKERAMRLLSTPVIQVWDGILTLPLVGDVDDRRSRQITEDLLQAIVTTQSDVVLLDITGLGSINTSVIAQLLRTVKAAELIGAECWIVGVSAEVAQTIVTLGIDLRHITTYAELREGLRGALQRLGLRVTEERPGGCEP